MNCERKKKKIIGFNRIPTSDLRVKENSQVDSQDKPAVVQTTLYRYLRDFWQQQDLLPKLILSVINLGLNNQGNTNSYKIIPANT